MKKYIAPVLWILAFQVIAGGIGYITSQNMGWYDTLEKSALTPPDIAFPIMWTSLYIMLALAGWMMWQVRKTADEAHRIFWMQMFLNWGWSFVFFGFHLVFIAMLWIVVLLVTMLVFVVKVWDQQRIAAYLVIPTILWGCFATYLNYAIWILN